jgi:hypothetical protein
MDENREKVKEKITLCILFHVERFSEEVHFGQFHGSVL